MMTCPKCGGDMRQYERNGVTVDQCEECRGIFLDRGELERLVQAEDVHMAGTSSASPEGYPQQGYPPAQRPGGSFLGGLFGEGGGHHGGYRRGHH